MICLNVCDLCLTSENVTLIEISIGADAFHVLPFVGDENCGMKEEIRVLCVVFWEIVSERYLKV